MKKILVIGMSDNIGGIETYFHNYYQQMNLKKYHFDFATVCDSIAFADEYRKNGSKIFKLPNFTKHPIAYYNRMRKIMHDGKYDIAHINMLSAANVLPVKAAEKENISNIIIHSHSSNAPRSFLKRFLHRCNKKYLSKNSFARVSCGKQAGEWLFGSKCDFKILNNAIDLDRFAFNRQYRKEIRDKYQIKSSDFLLGNVGQVSKIKNQSFLIDVLKRIGQDNLKLMIVGDDKSNGKFKKKAERAGLSDKVIVINKCENVEKYYSAFDLFVFPSTFEGMPLAPVEAEASGLKCVLADFLASREVLSNQYFANINDVDSWANIIKKELAEPTKRVNYKKHIEKNGFDISKEKVSMDLLYDPCARQSNTRIPKIIHYCWFGGGELSELEKKCIASWEKHCPDYKIIRWNEKNFDLDDNQFAKEAYGSKKWAFVSDYVRLFVLYKYGGIYMDTDMELINSMDSFLKHNTFLAFESHENVGTGLIGCTKKAKLIKKLLDSYKHRKFINADGSLDLTTNVVELTELCVRSGLVQNGEYQVVDDATIFSADYFYPKSLSTRKTKITNNTVAIHHCSGSWLTKSQKKRIKLRDRLYRTYGDGLGWVIYQTVYFPFRLCTHIKDKDIRQTFRKLVG